MSSYGRTLNQRLGRQACMAPKPWAIRCFAISYSDFLFLTVQSEPAAWVDQDHIDIGSIHPTPKRTLKTHELRVVTLLIVSCQCRISSMSCSSRFVYSFQSMYHPFERCFTELPEYTWLAYYNQCFPLFFSFSSWHSLPPIYIGSWDAETITVTTNILGSTRVKNNSTNWQTSIFIHIFQLTFGPS